ncbi:MAG: hypothetical protein ACRC62_05745 [Microcoleus sp.]
MVIGICPLSTLNDRERGRSHYNSQSIASGDARTITLNRSRAGTLAL